MYWLTSANGVFALRRAPRAGGNSETLFEGPEVIASMAWGRGKLVFSSRGAPGEVFAFDVETRTRTSLGKGPSNIEVDPFGVSADDDFAYAIGHDTGTLADLLFRVSLDGGKLVQLTRIERPIVQDVKGAFVDATHVYWATPSGYVLRASKSAQGQAEVVVDDEKGLSAFAVGTSDIVYASAEGGRSLLRVAKSGGTPRTVFADADARYGLAMNDRDIVYATESDGLHRVDLGGNGFRVITRDRVVSCGSILLEGDHLFFANTATVQSGGSVRRVCL